MIIAIETNVVFIVFLFHREYHAVNNAINMIANKMKSNQNDRIGGSSN